MIETIRAGDTDAFRVLVQQYHRLVIGYFAAAMSDDATVEELTIEWQQPSMDDWFASLLQRHSDRLHSDKLELASFIALRALNGVLVATVEEQPELLESKEFREQLVHLLLRYLCR